VPVCQSVCPVDRQQQRREVGLLPSAARAADIDRPLRASQLSGCGQRLVESRGTRLNTDLSATFCILFNTVCLSVSLSLFIKRKSNVWIYIKLR